MAVTAKRNNLRLLAIVLGETVSKVRNNEVVEMLDYGFNMYSIDKIVDKGNSLGIIKVNLGSPEYVDIVSQDDIIILNNSQKGKRNIKYEIKTDDITAPVKVGDRVGKISVYENNKFKKAFQGPF